jgi:transcriptional regulator with XRE-family HTH domain
MAKGLTLFGKEVRKYRIEAEASLKEMAEYLGVTSAYLSGIETGDRSLSAAVVERAIAFFKKRGVDATNLRAIADGMRRSVNIEGLDHDSRIFVAEFARRLSDMPPRKRHQTIYQLRLDLKDKE